MSKNNQEVTLNDIYRKIAALSTKIASQSALIEAQSVKIQEQQQLMQNCSDVINDQKRVVEEILTKIVKLTSTIFTPQKEIAAYASTMQVPTSVSENEVISKVWVTTEQDKEDVRSCKTIERAKPKAAPIVYERQRFKDTDPIEIS